MATANDIEWANKYYEEPDLVRYAGLIHLLSRIRNNLQDAQHTGRLLGAAMQGQPERIHDAWKEHLCHIQHPEFQRMLIFALWYSNTEQAKELLRRLAKKPRGHKRGQQPQQSSATSTLMRLKARASLQADPPENVLEKPLQGEDVIEELWDNFLMLGDRAYLDRMGIAAAYRSPEKANAELKSTWEQHKVHVDQEAADLAAYKMFTMSYQHKPMAEAFQGLYMKARDPDAPARETDGRVLRGTATVQQDVPGLQTQ